MIGFKCVNKEEGNKHFNIFPVGRIKLSSFCYNKGDLAQAPGRAS